MIKYIAKFETQEEYEESKYDLGYPNVSYIVETDGYVYEKEQPTPTITNYVKFSTTGRNSVRFDGEEGPLDVECSYDGLNWETWANPTDDSLYFGADMGDVYIRGMNPDGLMNNRITFSSANDLVDVEGNAMALIDWETLPNEVPENGLKILFRNCTALYSVSEDFLPATSLAYDCYGLMFDGCTSLVSAPELPATELANYCYRAMFAGCTSLVNAPELPATTLADDCYEQMFQGCTSLVNAPVLSATTLSNWCYNAMFYGCTSLSSVTSYATNISASACLSNWLYNVSETGTLRVPSSMVDQYPSGASGIPSGWEYGEIFIPE